eukprot:6295039-Prymnesium_polylepis.1
MSLSDAHERPPRVERRHGIYRRGSRGRREVVMFRCLVAMALGANPSGSAGSIQFLPHGVTNRTRLGETIQGRQIQSELVQRDRQ